MQGIRIEKDDPETKGKILDEFEYYARRNVLHSIKPTQPTGNEGRAAIFLPNGKKVMITSSHGAKQFNDLPSLNIQAIYTDDTRGNPIESREVKKKLAMLTKAADKIKEELDKSNELVIYCKHGRSRSPSALGAYLMTHLNFSKDQALTEIVKAFGVKATALAHDNDYVGPPLHATLATVPKTHQSSDYNNAFRDELNVEQDLSFLAAQIAQMK